MATEAFCNLASTDTERRDVIWSSEEEKAIEELKWTITTVPDLAQPWADKMITLDTYASIITTTKWRGTAYGIRK